MEQKSEYVQWLVRPHYIGSLHSVVYEVRTDGSTANIAIVKTENAGIIAAAPDLLQAAIHARDELAKHIVFREHPQLMELINNAIVKATK